MKERHNRTLYHLFSTLAWSAFFVFSLVVQGGVFQHIDRVVTERIQHALPRIFDIPFSVVTILGSSEVTVALVVLIFLVCFMKVRKIYLGIFLFFLMYIVELIGKFSIVHTQPPPIFRRFAFDFSLPSSFIVPVSYSFPSGHTARSTFLVLLGLFLISRFQKKCWKKTAYSVGLLVFLGIVLVSRVYLGEHWVSDVIGGLLLGIATGLLAASLW